MMRHLFALILLVLFTGCANFQIPNIQVQDKESGFLVGCVPVPERNVQRCDYENDRYKFTVEIPLSEIPPDTNTPAGEMPGESL